MGLEDKLSWGSIPELLAGSPLKSNTYLQTLLQGFFQGLHPQKGSNTSCSSQVQGLTLLFHSYTTLEKSFKQGSVSLALEMGSNHIFQVSLRGKCGAIKGEYLCKL